ncbi:ATPase AAA [Sulfurifustis variabilis]|uniref:ATPase AAA n=1 Tax=Sulfurifustis variabilis TaxID=1675686 RepID=A0A1B4VAJ5_9GAMM|nr:AAA family ATPase [Sulfurifustis variabilis]BAU47021.1 ATPase AAA [Sulfurifustis variabilis]
MYNEHFGLRELPFGITPDTSFFFPHSSHQEALNTLLVAARTGEGFMKVVGEVGTGKTMLCRKFLDALDREHFVTAYIPNPYLGPNTLLLAVAEELGIANPEGVNQHLLLKLITKSLLDSHVAGRRVVLCLDEAQAMPIETLEALRLLTNLETERRKLLQVVLFGQPELDAKLDSPAIRQLKQRITFSYRLRPLHLCDVEFYLAHRLTVAGYRGPRLFRVDAVKRLFRGSGGVPRLVNVLAHKSLMAAFGEGVREIAGEHVRLAIADTEAAAARPSLRFRLPRLLATIAGMAALATAAVVWGYWS